MSEPQAPPEFSPPVWPTCTVPECIGIRIDGQDACLAHVDEEARKGYLAGLRPGGPVDLRGTVISAELIGEVLAATRTGGGAAVLGDARFDRVPFSGFAGFDEVQFTGGAWFSGAEFSRPAAFGGARFSGPAWFGEARCSGTAGFNGAEFSGPAVFSGARFSGDAWFGEARFSGPAGFNGAEFSGDAWFGEARFSGDARFDEAEFSDTARFYGAQFSRDAGFGEAQFSGPARFDGAQFSGDAKFVGSQFSGDARFGGSQFSRAGALGPLLGATNLILDRVSFAGAMIIDVATPRLSCVETSFQQGATVRARYAEIVLDGAVFATPSTLAYAEDIFSRPAADPAGEGPLFDETPLHTTGPRPRVLSLRRVDVSTLVLADVDLSACLFQGAHHLDQLRIEGARPFASTPAGWKFGRVGGQGVPVWRWTRRQTLAEEHQWRAGRRLPAAPSGRPHPQLVGWFGSEVQAPWLAGHTGRRVQPLRPGRVAVLYRGLRKAQEDSKDEPGAADFYYGEMEMRRLASATPWGERVILTLYWLVSGYGLRGLRALAWLLAVVVGLAGLLQAIGFNGGDPGFRDALIYAAQSTISIASGNKALTEHVSWAGEVLRIALRLVGPVLLGLALLAVRNRVKR
jgi:uncharacterized protein YjbI with pentapeptide repeats